MASTGTALYPGASTFPNTNVYPGQGGLPMMLVQYTTDDLSVLTPTWNDATKDLRAHSTSRGRADERSEDDAGTATITLGNKAGTYDPAQNASIRIRNRWWIREQFTGETQDIFKGYADSYTQSWPDPGTSDAVTVVHCTDEMKVLALDGLPVTDPPRDTYQDVVMFDNPSGYWPITYAENPTATVAAQAGSPLVAVAASANQTGDPILGQDEPMIGYIVFATGSAGSLKTGVLATGDAGDVSGLSGFALETWIKFSTVPAGTRSLIKGPNAAGANTYELKLNTAAKIDFTFNGVTTITGSRVLAVDTWYHVVTTLVSGRLSTFINGVEDAFATGITSFGSPIDASQVMTVYDAGANIQMSYDEIAIYRTGLSASRIAAHYTAGALRGFARNQLPRDRFNAILDSVGSHATRRFTIPGADSHNMQGVRMRGQAPADELRSARNADAIDARLFIGRDGAIVFLDYDHRSGSPYNTVQATFDDDGTDLPYAELVPDFSDAFLANTFNVTRVGGTVQIATDATSRGRYGNLPQSINDLPVVSDSVALSVATAMLAKYKDPMNRITSITLTTHLPAVTEAAFRRDLGDRIQVFHTKPGGSRESQTLFIQNIRVDGSNDTPGLMTIVWGVSPL